jgi:hypothetical protein
MNGSKIKSHMTICTLGENSYIIYFTGLMVAVSKGTKNNETDIPSQFSFFPQPLDSRKNSDKKCILEKTKIFLITTEK